MRIPSEFVAVARWLRDRGLFHYRCSRVVRCDTLEIDTCESAIEVDIHEASEEDLGHLAPMLDNTVTEWLTRKANGSVCHVAQVGSAYQGFHWITRSAQVMTEVNHVIDVSRDALGAYVFSGYVLPSWRRKGVLGALLRESKRWARRQGLSRLYSAFSRDNYISERALRKAGFVTVVGDVAVVRVLDREWKRVRRPHGTPMIDVLGIDAPSRPAPSSP